MWQRWKPESPRNVSACPRKKALRRERVGDRQHRPARISSGVRYISMLVAEDEVELARAPGVRPELGEVSPLEADHLADLGIEDHLAAVLPEPAAFISSGNARSDQAE